jgi:hypothetical protein
MQGESFALREEDEKRMAVHHPAETTQNYSKEFFSSPIKTSAKTSEFLGVHRRGVCDNER